MCVLIIVIYPASGIEQGTIVYGNGSNIYGKSGSKGMDHATDVHRVTKTVPTKDSGNHLAQLCPFHW